jgi:hypothetical protein
VFYALVVVEDLFGDIQRHDHQRLALVAALQERVRALQSTTPEESG